MTSIDRISTSLNLTGTTGSISRSSSSNNKNLAARVDGVHVAFSRSYLRINEAVDSTTVTKEALENILNITEELITIAEEAKKRSISNSKRSRLNRDFQNLVDDFRDIIEDAEKDGVNLLDAEDLKEVFSEAGLDTSNVKAMAEVFNRIAGKDEQLGIEPIRSRRVSLSEKEKVNRRTTINVGQTEDTNDGTFSAAATQNTTSTGTEVFTADFDNDGELDLVRYTNGDQGFSVEIGNGDGTFTASTITMGHIVSGVTTTDFNNDGNVDIIANTSGDGSLHIYSGNGDGTFNYSQLASAVAPGNVNLFTADFDGDNNLDILSLQEEDGGSVINILRGNGDGTFLATTTYAVGDTPTDATIDDFNSDRILDIAVTNDGGVTLLTGDGEGAFTVSQTLSITGADSVESYDFDNDGRKDIVALSTDTDSVQVFKGNGDGTFSKTGTYTVAGFPDQLSITDINGDGNIDIITSSSGTSEISIVLGNGDGTFQTGVTLTGADSTQGLTIGDFNSDGANDLLTTGPASQLNLLLGNTQTVDLDDLIGNGTFTRVNDGGAGAPAPQDPEYLLDDPLSYTTNNGPTSIELYDFDGDGELDIVTANAGSGGTGTTVGVQIGNGDGTFQVEQEYEAGGQIRDVIGGNDLDGDGNQDLVTAVIGSGSGTPTFLDESITPSVRGEVVELADIDNDGNLDKLIFGGSVPSVSFSLGNGDGTFSNSVTFAMAGSLLDVNSALVMDFNNDGNLDIIAALDRSVGNAEIVYYAGNGNGTFDAAITTFESNHIPNEQAQMLRSADLDGDGNLDLVMATFDAVSGEHSIKSYTGNGDGTFNVGVTLITSGDITAIDLVDYNNDGDMDVSAALSSNGTHIFTGVGDGTFSGTTLNFESTTVGHGGFTTYADLDGDGNIDAVSNSGLGIGVFMGNGDGSFDAEDSFSLGIVIGDSILEDVDGDGNLDFIASRSSSPGVFGVTLGNGDGTFRAPSLFEINGITNSPYYIEQDFGDFNNDGNLDFILSGTNGGTQISYGNGDGTFNYGTAASGVGASSYVDVAVYDLDSDGNEDLLLTRYGGGGTDIYLGHGDGSFTLSEQIHLEVHPGYHTKSELADIDGDGNMDLISVMTGSTRVSLGNGDGTFQAQVTYDSEMFRTAPYDVLDAEIYDVDGDGNLDLIYSKSTFSPNKGIGYVQFGNGDGTFQAEQTAFAGYSTPRQIAVADLDGNGLADIHYGVGDQSYEYSPGNGPTLGDRIYTDGGASIGNPHVAGDIDNDGNDDDLILNIGSQYYRVINGGTATNLNLNSVAGINRELALADFNGDGNQDIIRRTSSNEIFVNYGNGNGTFQHSVSFGTHAAGQYGSIATGDLDGDGKDDIFLGDVTAPDTSLLLTNVSAPTGANIQLLTGNGDGTLTAGINVGISGNDISQAILADIDNDGNSDVITANGTDGTVTYFTGNGDGTFNAAQTLTVGGTVSHVSVTDSDGDGNLDIVAATDSGGGTLATFRGLGDGTFDLIQTVGDGTYQSQVTQAFGTLPNSILLDDFNGDGNLDRVILDSSTDDIYISTGNGDGTFAITSTNSAFGNLVDVLTGDFDNDGNTDVIGTGDHFTFFQGQGDGTFTTSSSQLIDYAPNYVISGDFNNDGNLDIATTNLAQTFVGVHYGNGDGTFAAHLTLETIASGMAHGIAGADFDGDGNLDILNSLGSAGAVIHFSNGDGTFDALQTIATGSTYANVDVADFNNDGNIDVMLHGSSSVFLAGNGDGTFLAPTATTLPNTSFNSRVVDINGDGNQDVLAYTYTDGAITQLLGNGDGTFSVTTSIATSVPTFTSEFAVGDVNGDGAYDIYLPNSAYNSILYIQGNTTTIPSGPNLLSTGETPTALTTADIDGDGNTDYIVGGDSSFSVFYSNGDGTFLAQATYATGSAGITDIRTSDLDGDGNLDVVISSNGGDSIQRLMGNGDGTFEAVVSEAGGTNYEGIAIGDLDGNGLGDIVASDLTNSEVDVLLGNSDAATTSGYNGLILDSSANTSTGPTSIELYDFNGDGELDIVTANAGASGSGTLLGVQLGNGDGTFQLEQEFDAGGVIHDIDGGADIDGDGNIDIVAVSSVDAGGVAGTFNLATTFREENNADMINDSILVDINNDGNLDYVYTSTESGSDALYTIAYGQGDGTLSGSVVQRSLDFGIGGDIVAGDINNDGNADLVITSIADYGIDPEFQTKQLVLLGNGNGTFTQSMTLTQTGTEPSSISGLTKLHDFDGDGNLDLLKVNGSIDFYKGNGDGTFDDSISLNLQGSASNLELFDYNNDGITDIAITANSYGDSGAQIFTGVGDGTFTGTAHDISLETNTLFASMHGDLDGDGDLDLFGNVGFEFIVYENTGSGNFSDGVQYANDLRGSFMLTEDVDGDGNLDIISASSSLDEYRIALGNGDLTFENYQTHSFGTNINSATFVNEFHTGDFDNDGNIDLLTSGVTSGGNTAFQISYGNGDGTFDLSVTTVIGVDAKSSDVGDLDGDGNLDVVVNSSSGSFRLLGNGDGSFSVESNYDAIVTPGEIRVNDVDGDGNLDIVVASPDWYTVALGNGDGSFAAPSTLNTGTGLSVDSITFELGDVDGDGNIDIVNSFDGASELTWVNFGNGDGSFSANTTVGAIGGRDSIQVADIDNDGRDEFLIGDVNSKVTLQYDPAGASFSGDVNFSAESNLYYTTLVSGDFDGDGNDDDLLFTNGNNQIRFIADGSVVTEIASGEISTSHFEAADINADGHLDLIGAQYGAGLIVNIGNGDGTFSNGVTYLTENSGLDFYSGKINLGDLNGDGTTDVIVDADYYPHGMLFLGNGAQIVSSVSTLSGNGNGTFSTGISLETGSSTASQVLLSDIDSDGNSDIVTANTTDGTVTYFTGNGNGTFNAAQTLYVGGQVSSIALSDVDGDGNTDILATSTNGSGEVQLFTGNGNSTFNAAATFSASGDSAISKVITADLDGDGSADIITDGNNSINVQYGNGDGTFAAETIYNTGSAGITDFIASDIDGDGSLDIVIASNGGDTVQRMMGNGDRTFEAAITEASGANYEGLALGDLNNDGTDDIVASDSTNSEVDILLGNSSVILTPSGGNGSGGFATGDTPTSIAAGDIDGDGITDFITADSIDNTLSFLAGNGDGTFAARATLNGGNTPGAVTLTDINGDGNLDIVSSASGAGEVLIQTGNGDGTFNLTTTFSGTTNATEFIARDINGDGNIDLIANSTSTGNASVFLGNGDGTISAATQFASGTDVEHIASTDINGDGALDLITSSATDNQVYVSLGDGSGNFGAATAVSAGADISAITTADVNRDGVDDIITGSSTEGTASVLYGNGDGTFRARISHSVGTEVTTLTVNDINGDGTVDILAADDSTDTLNVLTGNVDGTFSAARTYTVSDGVTHIITPDMNGDAASDVAVLSSTGASINTFTANLTTHTNGTGTFSSSATFSGQVSSDVELRDINGDGVLDAITADTAAGTVSVFTGNSDGTFNLSSSYSAGGSPEQVRVRDVNNDGIQDIITTNGAESQVGVLLGNADGTYQAATNFDTGSSPNDFTLFDINKDGEADIITVNEDSGDLSVLLSNGNGTFNAATTLSAPDGVTSVEAFDADGDGNVDLVAAGKYRIDLLSGNGDGTFNAAQSTQIPGLRIEDIQKVDIDGDGDIDIVAASSKEAKVLKNDGSGNFTAGDSYNIGTGVDSIEVTDLNGDGAQDIVANSTQLDTIRILMGYSDGTFQQTTTTLDVGDTTSGLAVGDINGDGAIDIVATIPDQSALFTALALGQNQQAQAEEETTIKETKTVRDVADPDSTDPLDRHVKSRANAIVSSETLEELKEYIEEDLEGIESVLEDLKTANTLARNGLLAANSISQDVDSYSTAQEIANTLRNSILYGTKDDALRVYSAFDQMIVSNLLK